MCFTLRELRNRFGLTRSQEAKVVKVSPQTIANAESGRCHPSMYVMARLSRLYNVKFTNISDKPYFNLVDKSQLIKKK